MLQSFVHSFVRSRETVVEQEMEDLDCSEEEDADEERFCKNCHCASDSEDDESLRLEEEMENVMLDGQLHADEMLAMLGDNNEVIPGGGKADPVCGVHLLDGHLQAHQIHLNV